MDGCVTVTPNAPECAGRGTACILNSSQVICSCKTDYTGFGDFNPQFDNCDVYIPILYFLGGLVLVTDVLILIVVAWAIRQRSLSTFFVLLKTRNAPAALTISALIVALFQIAWMSLRLSAIEARGIGIDAATTVLFAFAILFIYVSAPHVLRHYAKLTFSDARLKMLNIVGREQAKRRANLVRPLVNVVLPICAAISAFGPCVSLGSPEHVRLGLQIMGIATAAFLSLTLVLIRLLISPMVRDMKFAVSMKRVSIVDQDSLVTATQKLVFFQYLIVIVSSLYIPIMLLWSFLPALLGTISYIYFLGAWFCGCICGFSVYTLTNVAQQGPSNASSSVSNPIYKQVADAGIVADISSATPVKPEI